MEELWHREGRQAELTRLFRQTINRVLGNRDLRVSFRIGTRRYAWSENLDMPGGRQIEESRDSCLLTWTRGYAEGRTELAGFSRDSRQTCLAIE